MHITPIARDVLLVVLGAGLAVAAEEWRDRRNEHKRTTYAVESIRAEIMSNRRKAEGARAHHLAMADTLTGYDKRHELPPERVYFGGVFNPAHLLSTAWQTAHETGAINGLPYNVVLKLAAAYDDQESYRNMSASLGQSIMSESVRRGALPVFRDGYQNFIPLERDFSNREMVLARMYTGALARLDSLPH